MLNSLPFPIVRISQIFIFIIITTFILDTSSMIQMNRVKSLRCALCGKGIINFRYKAMPQWNISGELCGECYGKKLTEHYISAERQTTIKNN
jgi:hypothetical protein